MTTDLCDTCACVGCSEGNCCGTCGSTPIGFREYQNGAAATARGHLPLDGEKGRLSVAAMGLCGESGELVDHIKKHVGHGHELDREAVAKELGDVLWYIAEIATTLGMDLQQIAERNEEKLRSRYPEGFSVERSRNRGANR
jgi:NTP pyrophosphatase (non-canonical NTP hydrolase)